ncbi:MAG: FAD-linked oxidase C-terminal domain-containing protein [Thermodesulfobacteriota bacterium]
MLTSAAIKELRKAVGNENVSFSKEDAICYSYDALASPYLPDCVVFPVSAEEVSAVLKAANRFGFPVVPRGAGTGFSGGSLPVEGGVVLSTERMGRIIEIDNLNFTAEVEPGVITADLQDEAEAQGLFYPPDPTSVKFSTIGGNIAECAGGPRAVKYGVTKDYVLGLEVVLPTGVIIRTGGKKTMKGVVGYDLTKLMVGSEGTLGIVTRAYLKLLPLPEARRTMLIEFPDIESAAEAASKIISSGIIPSMLEFIDGISLKSVSEYTGTQSSAGAVLLVETDGREECVGKDSIEIKKISIANKAYSFKEASTKNEVRDLWSLRRAISPSLNKLKPTKLNEDVVVPRSELVSLVRGLEKISEKRNVLIASFGHAGDGNIHVNVMVDKKNADEFERGMEAVKDVFSLALSLGGAISGEHGIGITKSPYIGMELSPGAIEAMEAIKKAFDPNGILNPGKIFPRRGLSQIYGRSEAES